MILAIIGIVLGSLAFLYLIFIICFSIRIVHMAYRHKHQTRAFQVKRFHFDEDKDFLAFHPEPLTFVMSDGYVINGDYYDNNSNLIMILVHGHGSTRESMYKYVPLYKKMGFSILRYDQRGHGDNVDTFSTMGRQEALDLKEIVDQVRERYPNKEIALTGMSLGGATISLVTKYDQNFKLLVVDCAYSSVESLAAGFAKIIHQPGFLFILPCRLFFRLKYGFSMKEDRVDLALRNNHVPTLHTHGKKDTYVWPKNMETLYKNNAAEIKEKHYLPNGIHANDIVDDPLLYEEIFRNFYAKVQ